jgi:hypothetical protein
MFPDEGTAAGHGIDTEEQQRHGRLRSHSVNPGRSASENNSVVRNQSSGLTRRDQFGQAMLKRPRLAQLAQGHLRAILQGVADVPRELRAVTRPIAARDYWTSSKLKHWITREIFNAVYVSRQRSADEDPLEPLMEALRHGDSLVIFPEGTRSNKGEPQAFKSGLYHLGEDRAGMEMKRAGAAVEDRDAEDVRRQHVAGELDALEV